MLTYCIFTNRISEAGNPIASDCLSIPLFPLYLQNRLTFDLELFYISIGRELEHSLQGIEGQDHRSRSSSWVRLWVRSDIDRGKIFTARDSYTAAVRRPVFVTEHSSVACRQALSIRAGRCCLAGTIDISRSSLRPQA